MTRTELKYLSDNGLHEPPICYCGQPLKFRSYKLGYAKYCCPKCANSDPTKKERTKQNIIAKYGVENISQLDSVKKKKEGKCNKGRGKPWTEKTRTTFRQTMLERYGVEHPSHLPNYISKREETWLTRYGVNHISKLESTRLSKRNKKYKELLKQHPDIISISHDSGQTMYHCICDNCGEFIIPHSIYYDRKRLGATLCTKCQPIGYISKSKLEQFIEEILIKLGLDYQKRVRGILGRKELDFYIPAHKLAIECNGVYWHSDKIKTDKKYHYSKFESCKRQGIQLLQLWEDWIVNKPDIVENLIKSKLGLFDHRLGARKCIIRMVDQVEADNILGYHIQGTLKAPIRYGLFYGDKLVAVMLFNKYRGSMMGGSNADYELSRFCCLPGYQIVGGANRLLKYFISQYKPSKIVSFSSNDISVGNLYNALNFINKKQSSGSYWYIQNNSLIRYHRFHFRKSELKRMGYESGTEFEIMNNLPYHRIYDSGTTCWELSIKKGDS